MILKTITIYSVGINIQTIFIKSLLKIFNEKCEHKRTKKNCYNLIMLSLLILNQAIKENSPQNCLSKDLILFNNRIKF